MEEKEEKSHQSCNGYRDPGRCRYKPPRKTDMGSYYAGAKRVSGLHDLLGRHHRTNGECIQMPVGNISKIGGGKGRLARPTFSLQYLMDYAVRPEQQKSSNLQDFMSLDPKILTILIRSMVDDRSEPKGDGVSGYPLPLERRNEENGYIMVVLFRPSQVNT